MTTQVSDAILSRKGSRTTAGVPAEVRALLNSGQIETVNLSEWLVIDSLALATCVCRENHWDELLTNIHEHLRALKIQTAPKKGEAIGRAFVDACPSAGEADRTAVTLTAHRSDVVRSWAAYLIGFHPRLTLPEKLTRIRLLASDRNMGVRETAWLAVRESIAADLDAAIAALAEFSTDADPCIRRFASEATRPRGVWCRHIPELKSNPAPGLAILDPLRSDPSKYVRDSVGNWLNDASKTCPDWVRSLCKQWTQESPSRETAYIVKRALRTIEGAQTKGCRAAR